MPAATESDDALLVSREPGSFAVSYRRHVEDLAAFFMRRTRNAELAADLTAETFAAALVARTRFDPGRGNGSAWLYGIAVHKLARLERHAAAERRARRRLGWSGSSSPTLTSSASTRWGRVHGHTYCWTASAQSSATRSGRT